MVLNYKNSEEITKIVGKACKHYWRKYRYSGFETYDDTVQEIWLHFLEKNILKKYDPMRSRLSTYIYLIVSRYFREKIRKRTCKPDFIFSGYELTKETELTFFERQMISVGSTFSDKINDQLFLDSIYTYLKNASKTNHHIIFDLLRQGYKQYEIANLLNKTKSYISIIIAKIFEDIRVEFSYAA